MRAWLWELSLCAVLTAVLRAALPERAARWVRAAGTAAFLLLLIRPLRTATGRLESWRIALPAVETDDAAARAVAEDALSEYVSDRLGPGFRARISLTGSSARWIPRRAVVYGPAGPDEESRAAAERTVYELTGLSGEDVVFSPD